MLISLESLELDKIAEIKNISFWPGKRGSLKILNEISFEIFRGEIIAIVGESGAGKTTLAKIIAGIIPASDGEIVQKGSIDKNGGSLNIQLLFQNNEDLINPLRKVKSIISDKAASKEILSKTMTDIRLQPDLLESRGSNVSGGERQRIALARLLVTNPELLILDEPFSAQDIFSKLSFIELLSQLNKSNNLTLIVITHEINLIKDFADRIIVMFNGRIVEIGSSKEFFTDPGHPYSRFLIDSSDYKLSRVDIQKEETNDSVCSYYSRCERRKEDCVKKVNCDNKGSQMVYCNFPCYKDTIS